MVTILIRHTVVDYARWKGTFDANELWRMQSGERSYWIFRDVDNSNVVTLLLEWTTFEEAQQFIQSDDLRRKMQDAGVIGTPDISILREEAKETRNIG